MSIKNPQKILTAKGRDGKGKIYFTYGGKTETGGEKCYKNGCFEGCPHYNC